MISLEQKAALIALLRTRPEGMGWPDIGAEVAFTGDAVQVWDQCTSMEGGLIRDPHLVEELARARRDVEAWSRAGLRLLTVLDETYPARLLDIRESPPFLFAMGELRAHEVGMSVVGSRKPSDRGRHAAESAARLLVDKGLTVIAGLAAGIDSAAHRTALSAGGRTVAVLGTGITQYYPVENRALQDEISNTGLVLSQFWPDAAPTKRSFPIRNATMSGYGMATIVIEASEFSGTRIQARLAVEHGRPVILTDRVVSSTQWGKDLADRPGVHIVSGLAELDSTIDAILAEHDALTAALHSLPTWVS